LLSTIGAGAERRAELNIDIYDGKGLKYTPTQTFEAHTEDLWERGKESTTAVEALLKLAQQRTAGAAGKLGKAGGCGGCGGVAATAPASPATATPSRRRFLSAARTFAAMRSSSVA
jgi:hypothetical protein